MRLKGWFQSQIPDKCWKRDVHSSPPPTLSTFPNSHLLPLIPSPLHAALGISFHLIARHQLLLTEYSWIFRPSTELFLMRDQRNHISISCLFLSVEKIYTRLRTLIYIYIYTRVCFRWSWYLCVSLEITRSYYLCLRHTISTSWIRVCIYPSIYRYIHILRRLTYVCQFIFW